MFLLKVRPFDLLIDIVNQPWRGFKPPKRQLQQADGAGTPASICSPPATCVLSGQMWALGSLTGDVLTASKCGIRDWISQTIHNYAMPRHIRNLQPALGWLMAVVLLLPMLIALLPSPASAEETQLYQDLQASRCAEQGIPMSHEHHDCDHCVLSDAVHVPKALGNIDPHSEPVRLRRQTEKVAFVFVHMDRVRRADTIFPISGRGPPA